MMNVDYVEEIIVLVGIVHMYQMEVKFMMFVEYVVETAIILISLFLKKKKKIKFKFKFKKKK